MALPKTPSFRLDGRRALVTGASSGIGYACAVALAEAGADVTLAARSADKLASAVDEIRAAGLKASALLLDITDIAGTALEIEQMGPYDVMLNSAGIAKHGSALDTVEVDFDAVTNINVKAAYFLSQVVAKGMIAAKKTGSIIHISSQMAHVGGVDRAVYCSTKHAVEGFVKAMAIEWGGNGIRINTICPTFIRTALAEVTLQNPERRRWIESKIKLGRVGEVEDVMGAAVFLASDAAALITGTSLLVDGGWTAE